MIGNPWPLLPQHGILWQVNIVKGQGSHRTGTLPQFAFLLALGHTFRVQVNDKDRHALMSGVRVSLGQHKSEIGNGTIVNPYFLAVQKPSAFRLGRSCSDAGYIRARLGFRDAIGNQRSGRQNIRKYPHLLIFGSIGRPEAMKSSQ